MFDMEYRFGQPAMYLSITEHARLLLWRSYLSESKWTPRDDGCDMEDMPGPARLDSVRHSVLMSAG